MSRTTLTVRQMAGATWTNDAVRAFETDPRVEHITLAGVFAHRMPARHASASRFTAWRLRIRAAELAKLYERLPLLGGAS